MQHAGIRGHREAKNGAIQEATIQVFTEREPLGNFREGLRFLCRQPAQLGGPVTGVEPCSCSRMNSLFVQTTAQFYRCLMSARVLPRDERCERTIGRIDSDQT